MEPERYEDQDTPKPERGSSGLGTLLALGTAAVATVSMIALFTAMSFSAPVIAATVGGLGLLAGGLLVVQHHKEKVNTAHVNKNYNEDDGYHKEPEKVQDQSLIHLIHGRSDLAVRLNYIDNNYAEYGIKPLSADQYRTKYMGTGAALGVLAGAAVMAGLAVVMTPFVGAAVAVAFGGVMGALAGGSTLAFHTAHTMKRYDAYLDTLAAEGEAKKKQAEQNCAPAPDYDNGCARKRTFCEEVTTSRCQPVEAVCR